MGWVKYSTVGAKAGDNIKDESGNVLANEDIRNDDLTVAYSGTNIQLKKAGSQIGSNVDAPTALKNTNITVNATTGILENIGTGSIKVNNEKQDWQDVSGTGIPADGATVGAIAGTNLKDSSNNSLGDEDVRNSDLSLAYSGTNIQIKKGSSQIGSDLDSPTALKNSNITIASDGILTGIGTSSIKVNNSKTEFSELQGTKPPADANKVDIAAGTDGRVSVNVNGAGASNIAVFSTTDRQKLTNLRAGKVPGDGSGTTTDSIQNDDIEINASGQLTGIGTDSIKVNNAKITTKADGTLNYDGTAETAPSLASISGTVPRTKGGFGVDIDALVGTGTDKVPTWDGSAWVASAFVYGDITVTDGGAAIFTSYDNGSNYTASNQTGTISITHPIDGTFTVDYAWGDLSGDDLTSFALTNATSGSTWSASTTSPSGTSESITVTHAESNPDKTIVMSAVTIKHNYGSGGGGGGGCFLPGTPVDLLNGETKAIEEMEIGDKVRGGTVLNKQAYQVDHWYKLDTLNLTAGHPVWIFDKGWSCIDPEEYYRECKEFGHKSDLEPKQIEVGDKTTAGEIEFIERVDEEQEVWNITVDNEHTYYVNGILVHNGGKE